MAGDDSETQVRTFLLKNLTNVKTVTLFCLFVCLLLKQEGTRGEMSKLYIGNLPAEANEAVLRQLLQDHEINVTSVLVKRGGYAFIDCPEQSTIERAIEQLNGLSQLLDPFPLFLQIILELQTRVT